MVQLYSQVYLAVMFASDILMVAYDADNGYVYFGRNGTWNNGALEEERQEQLGKVLVLMTLQ